MQSAQAQVARNVAIVGSGPTGLYTLHHLLASPSPLIITLFESSALAGVGLPYSPESTNVSMLANIASIEIPPLGETYLDWLRRQPDAILRLYGVDPTDLHDRQFLPRLLLGAWFRDAMERMLAEAQARGHWVVVREGTRVTDVAPVADQFRVTFDAGAGSESLLFSHVVLATGHSWPQDPEQDAGHFVSPWSGLMSSEIGAVPVGVLGTSLSGIDAAMAVASQHGNFVDADGLTFRPAPDAGKLTITLMSRQGLLPEADFWCPLPYEPLRHFSPDAVTRAAAPGAEGLLDRLWALFVREVAAADPSYAEVTGIAHLSPEGFAEVYFAPRLAADPFDWARANLAQVERNAEARRTVGWRYAILRMHEPMEEMVALLNETDRQRFEHLKRVFIDNYAAIPPQSIRRLLALHDAGVLKILALGDDYALQRDGSRTEIVTTTGERRVFDVFIDARGQKALTIGDLPFPTLRAALSAKHDATGPVPVAEDFSLAQAGLERLFLPAAPYLLSHLPFVQGITASHDLGGTVAAAILAEPAADTVAEVA